MAQFLEIGEEIGGWAGFVRFGEGPKSASVFGHNDTLARLKSAGQVAKAVLELPHRNDLLISHVKQMSNNENGKARPKVNLINFIGVVKAD